MKKPMNAGLLVGTLTLMSGTTLAHVSVSGSGVATANKNFEATITVPHGCSDAAGNHFDTRQVEVELPAGFTGVRPADATFGTASVINNDAGTPAKIVWTKTEGTALPSDDHLYKFTVRGKLPDAPFSRIYFPTVQRCQGSNGEALTAEWTVVDAEHNHDAPSTTGAEAAPSVFIYPARSPGWNRYTVNEHVHDFSVFADAEIVWAGAAAYSANATTLDLIKADTSVTVLDAIHPGTEIWVKY